MDPLKCGTRGPPQIMVFLLCVCMFLAITAAPFSCCWSTQTRWLTLQNIPLIYFSKPDGLQLFAPFLISSFSFVFLIFFIFVTFTCFRSSQQALILEKDDPNKYKMQFLNEQSPTLCLWKSLICSFCFEAGDWFASCNEYASLYGRPG